MSITIKTSDDMVNNILDRIVAADIGFTDKSKSSVLRTIIESVVAELDIQYYQLGYIYSSMFLSTATGDDLDKLVEILNIYRQLATYCTGVVTFGRSSALTYDIPIYKGTIISTRSNISGKIYRFTTDSDVVLVAGATSVNANVTAVDPGHISVPAGHIVVMDNPVIGIDTVTNASQVDGGSDAETDTELRERAELGIQRLGKATNGALESALLDIAGIESVTVLDMNRGVGTSDVIVQCSSNPVPAELQAEINSTVAVTKASGINVGVLYPTVILVDVSVNTTVSGVDPAVARTATGNAIQNYFKSLGVNETFIIKQMENRITSVDGVVDMSTISPVSNQTCGVAEVIRCGTITINGEVW